MFQQYRDPVVAVESPSDVGTYVAKDSQGITLPGNTTVQGDLTVEGTLNYSVAQPMNVTILGNLTVEGVTTISGLRFANPLPTSTAGLTPGVDVWINGGGFLCVA